jgi:hypothetical protein
MPHPHSFAILLALAGLALAAAPAPAAAQDPLAACPRLAEHLQDQLTPVVAERRGDGRVEVHFRWQDRHASQVEVVGEPAQYHRFVRRALRTAPCPALATGGVYTLNIEFRDI